MMAIVPDRIRAASNDAVRSMSGASQRRETRQQSGDTCPPASPQTVSCSFITH